jgi:photosystem II stability/assembly factor-like uncharacterized protein
MLLIRKNHHFSLAGFLMITVLFLVISVYAGYEDWRWHNPLPSGNTVKDICFINTQKGWVVGTNGGIYHTADGGGTWIEQFSGTTRDLLKVRFIDENEGWVLVRSKGSMPYDGFFLHTSDGGKSWERQAPGVPVSMQGMYFLDADNGWGCGITGRIIRTTDGGSTWSECFHHADACFRCVFFVDADNGWAAGRFDSLNQYDGTVYHSADGGETWTRQMIVTDMDFSSIFFIDSVTRWAAGSSDTLWYTENGGLDWERKLYPGLTLHHVRKIGFVDSVNGWFVGGGTMSATDTIFVTRDGGAGWEDVTPDGIEKITSSLFIDPDNGWITDDFSILHTSDNGRNWEGISSSITTENLYDVHFTDPNSGWVLESNNKAASILHTDNGGHSWTRQPVSDSSYLNSIYFIDNSRGWAAGYAGIYYTTNGGEEWIAADTDRRSRESIHFADEQNGWIVGRGGGIYHTSDGGKTWNRQYCDTVVNLNSVYFVDKNRGWAVGGNWDWSSMISIWIAYVIHTTDGGRTWDVQFSERLYLGSDLHSVFFIDENTGWIAAGRGTMLHTVNAGQTWTFQNSSTDTMLLDIYFADKNNGCAVGYYGKVIKTSDGGATWEPCRHLTSEYLLSVFLVDSVNGWTVGTNSTILRTYPYGPVPVKEHPSPGSQHSSSHSHFKAFYNNRNSIITVEYMLSEQSFATLAMYDVLGRNVCVLADRFHARGTHTSGVDMSKSASGIYFLRLQTDNGDITRKLHVVR